jgi:phage tail protein X
MSDYIVHDTVENERWDQLAYRYYGDANRTEPIIRANREIYELNLSNIPAALPVGLTLRIPVLGEDALDALDENLLPPWKRGLGNAI